MIGNELQYDKQLHVTVSFTIINKKYLYLSDHAVWSTQSMTLPGI